MHRPRNDRETALEARKLALQVQDALDSLRLDTADPLPSFNLEGGWVIEAVRADGLCFNIEVVASPWDDDGSWKQEAR